ncbi:MAG: DUF5005 domain-containing protein [Lutibacter sp.]|nr:DUF5005 domain-containing protein [Lutibacter sp.]
MNIKLSIITTILLCGLFFSCKDALHKPEALTKVTIREVELDTIFGKLLIVDQGGVTGADGVISFSLPEGKSVFMMGDSFLSEVINGKRNPKSQMINNTFIELDLNRGVSKSIYKGSLDEPETMLIPMEAERTKEYYWPGHGFEKDSVIHIFMSKFWDDPSITEGWKFKFKGTDYLRLEGGSYKVISQEIFPFTDINNVHYGHSLLKEDKYTYIYGSRVIKNRAELHVARALFGSKENRLTDFEIFDGNTWVSDAGKTNALKGINKNVPEQFSVFKYGSHYILVMQERELSGGVYSYISNTPVGPWRNEKLLFRTTEKTNKKDGIITYNAMAHPQYIKDEKLLVSYCVNSLDVASIHENVLYYRPVFYNIPLEIILSD